MDACCRCGGGAINLWDRFEKLHANVTLYNNLGGNGFFSHVSGADVLYSDTCRERFSVVQWVLWLWMTLMLAGIPSGCLWILSTSKE